MEIRPTPVFNKTGLQGTHKINLRFSRGKNTTDPNIHQAIPAQMALKREEREGTPDVFAIDKFVRPEPN